MHPVSINDLKLGETYFVRRRGSEVLHHALLMQDRVDMNTGRKQFYVHYDGCDRRLDEWIDSERIYMDCASQVESSTKPTRIRKRRLEEDYDLLSAQGPEDFNESKILEKEHEQVTKVKHIEWIRYGCYKIYTWYFSPYPDDFGKASNLFVCDYCMKYMKYERSYRTHLHECKMRKPPGIEIYKHKDLAIYEVHGDENKIYCQCLCLLAKLFLDHKTLYFDVEPFVFYVLCQVDTDGSHMVGFFSKENGNLDGNNLACICILPPFQRCGYGKLLIQLSYELTKREGKFGSPEKPLSDLGRISYISYWSWVLIEALRKSNMVIISELSKQSGIDPKDIIDAICDLKLMQYWNGEDVLYITPKILEECRKLRIIKEPRLILRARSLRFGSVSRSH